MKINFWIWFLLLIVSNTLTCFLLTRKQENFQQFSQTKIEHSLVTIAVSDFKFGLFENGSVEYQRKHENYIERWVSVPYYVNMPLITEVSNPDSTYSAILSSIISEFKFANPLASNAWNCVNYGNVIN